MLSKPTDLAPNFPMGNPNKQKGENQQFVHMVTVTTWVFKTSTENSRGFFVSLIRQTPFDEWPNLQALMSHRIHVWYIYLHLPEILAKCR